jgi:hypothetical protein
MYLDFTQYRRDTSNTAWSISTTLLKPYLFPRKFSLTLWLSKASRPVSFGAVLKLRELETILPGKLRTSLPTDRITAPEANMVAIEEAREGEAVLEVAVVVTAV